MTLMFVAFQLKICKIIDDIKKLKEGKDFELSALEIFDYILF